MELHPKLLALLAEQQYPLLFVTVSGAHLYGFPSSDSDWDLRGAHVLPLDALIGIEEPKPETLDVSRNEDGLEADLVTHDIRKFCRLLLRPNGYVLEQLLSPLIIKTTLYHQELVSLAPRLITRHHAHHYIGFANTQWNLFQKESPRRVKPLLYVFRVLLTGIHLMQTGTLEANLINLNDTFQLPYLPELIQRKLDGTEKGNLPDTDFLFLQSEFERLLTALKQAQVETKLPPEPSVRSEINTLTTRIRRDLG